MIIELISFYKRRIYIPKQHQGLVLDVGSGDKPHFNADILVDKFIGKKYGAQRNGDDEVSINKPLFVSDIESLPFKDKIFDYVIASHILEHVFDPAAAVNEIVRVGKAGYIEVPFVGYQKIYDFCSHLWYCDFQNDTLIFTAKKDMIFDQDIDRFIRNDENHSELNIKIKDGEKCILKIFWKDNLKCKVLGKPDKRLMSKIEISSVSHNSILNSFRKIIISILEKVFHKNKTIFHNDLLKEEFRSKENSRLTNAAYNPTPSK
ncbi:MAG: hypothetical protein C0412_12215 [Flavobacterium sp.]|nr:hypothetical protein [Flavobacterium sp.]